MNERYQKSLGLTPTIFIDLVSGGLQVKGWMRSEVYISTSKGALDIQEIEAGVRFSCHGDCVLRVPRGANIQVGRVEGSARVKYLDHNLRIDTLSGSLAVRSVGMVQLGKVKGDLLVKDALGDLTAGEVAGSVVVRELQGACVLPLVAGNLDLRDVSGEVNAAIDGHARIELSVLSADGCRVNSGGRLQCQVPENVDAQVTLTSDSGEILVHLPGEKRVCPDRSCEFTLGSGEIPLRLSAGGKLSFVSREPDWQENEDLDEVFNDEFDHISDDFSRQFQDEIESKIGLFTDQIERLSDQMQKIGLSDPEIERVIRKARQTSQDASVRAHEKMRRAQEKLEQKITIAQHKAEAKAKAYPPRNSNQEGRGFRYEWTSSQRVRTGESPKNESANEEERLVILRMLEQKKISIEQAEELLEALEGKK